MATKRSGLDKDKVDGILAPVTAAEQARREEQVHEGIWRTVKRGAAAIPFMDEVVAAYYCATDPKTPFRVRGTLLAALAYFVMPIDMVPDFLFGLGFTDDLAVLTAAITAIQGHITPAHRKAARDALADRG